MNEKPKDPDDTIRKFPAWASEKAIQPSSQSIPQIIKVLARGGMGTIYEAEQYLPQRRVAIKKIDDPSDLELQNSLMQEAMIMGALDHPNIIPVHRILVKKGHPSVVMKLVQGSTFKECLKKGYSVQDSLRVMLQVCYAVEYAHQQNIIHRDIKPSNIMIGHFNEIYLLDWGIAIDLNQPDRAMDGFVGSPSYMAPEMLAGDPNKVSKQTDIYLLGSTLHYALTGRRRYESDSYVKLFELIEEAAPVDYGPEIPKELGILLNKACHKDPYQRPQSVGEFKESLLDIMHHWEVIQLTRDGLKYAKQCIDESERVQKEKLFNLARQDFEYALRIWPNSVSAQEGLRFISHAMVSFYLVEKDLRAAQMLYDSLEEPEPALKEKIDAVRKEESDLAAEQSRLLELGEANDFKETKQMTATFAMLIGLVCVFTSTGANLMKFYFKMELDATLSLYSSLAVLFVIVSLMFTRRQAWMSSLPMERLCTSALGTLICITFNRMIALKAGTELDTVLSMDCFIVAFGALMIAQIVAYGYLMPLFCALIGLSAIYFPILAAPGLSLVSLVVSFWAWFALKQR